MTSPAPGAPGFPARKFRPNRSGALNVTHEQQVRTAHQRSSVSSAFMCSLLLHPYVAAGRSGIFMMIGSAPSLYRYAHWPPASMTVPA